MPDAQRPLTILIAADTYPPHVNGAAQFGYRLAYVFSTALCAAGLLLLAVTRPGHRAV